VRHELEQLNDRKLIIDTIKPKLNKGIIGRWISISYNREFYGHKCSVFDAGVVTELKSNLVYIDYKTD